MARVRIRITRRQQRLADEIGELLYLFHLDTDGLLETRDSKLRTTRLEAAKDQLVRSEVMYRYTVVDEFLNTVIAGYFFSPKRPFQNLRRRERARLFGQYVLEELSLLKKLQLVRAIKEVPRAVREDVERLNALRNGLAHAYFPSKLRKSRPEWKGTGIFTIEGIRRFIGDMEKINGHFSPHVHHLVTMGGDGELVVAQQAVQRDGSASGGSTR